MIQFHFIVATAALKKWDIKGEGEGMKTVVTPKVQKLAVLKHGPTTSENIF